MKFTPWVKLKMELARMYLGIWLTLSVLVIFTVFGIAFAYIVFLASEKSSLVQESSSGLDLELELEEKK
jgi:hypothetical protein